MRLTKANDLGLRIDEWLKWISQHSLNVLWETDRRCRMLFRIYILLPDEVRCSIHHWRVCLHLIYCITIYGGTHMTSRSVVTHKRVIRWLDSLQVSFLLNNHLITQHWNLLTMNQRYNYFLPPHVQENKHLAGFPRRNRGNSRSWLWYVSFRDAQWKKERKPLN